jgi:ferredoxin
VTELRIDRELCAGHGRCFDIAPALFGEDAEGYGEVLVAVPAAHALGDARLAARSCPEQAVLLTGDGADTRARADAGAGANAGAGDGADPPEEI